MLAAILALCGMVSLALLAAWIIVPLRQWMESNESSQSCLPVESPKHLLPNPSSVIASSNSDSPGDGEKVD
jgi:hypothetical protein